MDQASATRRSPRIRTWFETHFSSQRQEGEGILADISYTGARIEDVELQPKVGAHTILYVSLPNQDKPFQLEGKVARHTAGGFAIAYEKPGPELRRGVDRVATLVDASKSAELDAASSLDTDDSADALDEAPQVLDARSDKRQAPQTKPGSDPLDDMDTAIRFEESKPEPAKEPAEKKSAPKPSAERHSDAPASVRVARRAQDLDLADYPLPELESLRKRIGDEIEKRRVAAKERVRREIEKLAESEGFTID
ncbi:MAG: PilZ domain-containing protein, partial [Myxococcales bacterium]|nr:PilZ domain-containing protein [Myxococcales bacterium]